MRLDALFRATYPVKRGLARVDFPATRCTVHKKVQGGVRARPARAQAAAAKVVAPFLRSSAGPIVPRNIAGTDRPSAHSYGIAIDLEPALTHYWRWQKGRWLEEPVPQAIVDAFEAEGFIWGGRWYHFDTMHFEYRPELLDGSCYPPAP